MNSQYPAIVVLAYNRLHSLKRLLNALDSAYYIKNPTLVISLEGDADLDVVNMVYEYRSDRFDIRIIRHKQKLGLRNHIMYCGDLSYEYGSVIILEDDLLVDKYYYLYTTEALRYYSEDDTIAGISLYSYESNEISGLPFRALQNGYSTYFMQVVSSWGQAWTNSQWHKFRTWYDGKTNLDIEMIDILPQGVKNWPESSWKKYYYAYITLEDKYFVYPYISYTTNYSDSGGTHIKKQTNVHQVAISSQNRLTPTFVFCPSSKAKVKYDSFFEPCGDEIYCSIGLSKKSVAIDLQGIKPYKLLIQYEFAITPRKAKHIIRKYGFESRPPENNFILPSNENTEEGWILCRTTDLFADDPKYISTSIINYYHNINIYSTNIIVNIFKNAYNILYNKIKNYYDSL